MSAGLVVVDKPGGWTSHQVVGRLRRLLGTRKIGHAGTLDPMATGLLLAGVGRATRLLGHLALTDKSYSATIRLGQATVTDDAEGEIIWAPGADAVSLAQVGEAIAGYRGTITQIPSAVSAIKVDGERAYARVRRGETVALAGREVTVSRYELIGHRVSDVAGRRVLDLDVRVDCSSGTYVRALARDLGEELGTGGHLTALRRTRVGGFSLADPHLLPESLLADPLQAGSTPLIPLGEVARRCFPVLEVDRDAAVAVRHGRALGLDGFAPGAGPTAVLADGEFLALYRREEGRAVPVAVFVG